MDNVLQIKDPVEKEENNDLRRAGVSFIPLSMDVAHRY